jgi:hypothetical protein
MRIEKGKDKKIAKGCKKCVVEDGLHFINYKNVLLGQEPKTIIKRDDKGNEISREEVKGYYTEHDMNTIRSKNHQLSTLTINKVGLCAYDDKSYILEDGINTLAYGHYKIPQLNL